MAFQGDYRQTMREQFRALPFVSLPLWVLCLLFLLVTSTNAQISQKGGSAVSPASFSLVSQRDAILSLRAPMRFHTGDDPRWSDPTLDDSAWSLQRGDRDWKSLGFQDLSGLAWYRCVIILPAGEDSYSIELPHIRTAYQVFIEGTLSLTVGDMPPYAHMYFAVPVVVELPHHLRSVPTPLHIALRVWEDPVWAAYDPGGPDRAITVGRTALITERFSSELRSRYWRNSDWFDLTALELFASLTALLLFLLGRSKHEYLWFCVLALGSSLNHAIRLWSRFYSHPVHLAESFEAICFTAYLLASLMFYRKLFEGRASPAFRVSQICCLLWFVDAQAGVLPWFSARAENTGELLFAAPVYSWILIFIFRRACQRWPDARLLAVPVSLLVGSCFYRQLLFTIGTYGHPEVMKYYPNVPGLFYVEIRDIAETVFLIAMLFMFGRRFARTHREADRTAAELEAARSVQRVLVPDSLPSIVGMSISTAYYPAQEVGGDFFQIIPLQSGDTLVVIGDVAGKGVPAALTVSLIVGALRILVDYVDGPTKILAALNQRLYERGAGFTTCLVMQIAATRESVTIANAGHLSAYADRSELVTEVNLPLGAVSDASFSEVIYPLRTGVHLVVMTDGVPEAMCKRELFGFERTRDMSGESASMIADAARNFGQTDDITVLSIDIISPQPTVRRQTAVHVERLACVAPLTQS